MKDKVINSIFWIHGLLGLIFQLFGFYIIVALLCILWPKHLVLTIVLGIVFVAIDIWKAFAFKQKGRKLTMMGWNEKKDINENDY